MYDSFAGAIYLLDQQLRAKTWKQAAKYVVTGDAM